MSREPTLPTWFPDDKLNPENIAALSRILQETARQLGFTRETYAAAVAQMAEALAGHNSSDDIDGEVLRFISERFRAVADAIDGSSN